MNVDEAMTKVCPQTVFACGFEDCTRVFESCSEDDTATTLKEYSGHVVKHFEEGSNGGRWSYSTRVRNLLRQSQVSALWEKAWPESERPGLQWNTQTSLAARKTLEARHLEKLPFLIQSLIFLGSDGGDVAKLEGRLEPPVKEKCRAPYCRKVSLDIQAHSPPPHDLERDMKQFNVSEGHIGFEYGSDLGSGLASGLASSAYRRMQQVPRSIEAFEPFEAFDAEFVNQTQIQHSNYSDTGAASLRHASPPRQLFYHGPTSSTMFTPSPAILPAALQPLQQQYMDGTQEVDTKSVISPAGFHSMQPVAADLGSGMDVDMAGSSMDNYNHTAPPAPAPASAPTNMHHHHHHHHHASSRECWLGHYSHMATHAAPLSSVSSEGYHLDSQCTTTPEHNRLLQHFGS